jgi:predicted O-methyltransferase YrrM
MTADTDLSPETPELSRYLTRYYKTVPGFSSLFSAKINSTLLRWQHAHGVKGDIAEIGVFLGRSVIALALAAAEEDKIVAVDKFTWPESALPQFRAYAKQFGVRESALVPLSIDTRDLKPKALIASGSGRKFRFFHVDGDHSPDAVRHDFSLAIESMSHGGIICLDDMLHPVYPELPGIVHDVLRRHPHLKIVCIIDREDVVAASKYVICDNDHFDSYKTVLSSEFSAYALPLEAEFFTSRALVLSLDAPIWSYYNRLS